MTLFPQRRKCVLVTWVITDGIYDSIAETMSHGMRGYAEAYGLTKLQVIGIVPWRRMSFQADLHSADFSVYLRLAYCVSLPHCAKRTL